MSAAEEAELDRLRLAEGSLQQQLSEAHATLEGFQSAAQGSAAECAALLSRQHPMEENVPYALCPVHYLALL